VSERDRQNVHEMVKGHEARIRRLEALDGKIENIMRDTDWIRTNFGKLIRKSMEE